MHGAGSEHGHGQVPQQGLGQLDQIAIVRIGRVELKHRELGIVARRQTLVAEVTIDLEHPFNATHHQALEIQLWRDAQIQIHIEAVVVRDKGSCRSTAGHHLHHRCLDFEIAANVQKATDELDDRGTHAKYRARGVVHDQVEITLAIAGLKIGQAMPFVR